jgi:hypothetical protein
MLDKFFKSGKKRPEQPSAPATITTSTDGEFIGDCAICHKILRFTRKPIYFVGSFNIAKLLSSGIAGYCYHCDIELCSQHIKWEGNTGDIRVLCPRCGRKLDDMSDQAIDILVQKDLDPVTALGRLDGLIQKANRYATKDQIKWLLEKRAEINNMDGKPKSAQEYSHGRCSICGESFLCSRFIFVNINRDLAGVGGYCYHCDVEVCGKHAIVHQPSRDLIEREWQAAGGSLDETFRREVVPNYRHNLCPKCNQRLNDLEEEERRISVVLQTNPPAAIAELEQLAEKVLHRGDRQKYEALRSSTMLD